MTAPLRSLESQDRDLVAVMRGIGSMVDTILTSIPEAVSTSDDDVAIAAAVNVHRRGLRGIAAVAASYVHT